MNIFLEIRNKQQQDIYILSCNTFQHINSKDLLGTKTLLRAQLIKDLLGTKTLLRRAARIVRRGREGSGGKRGGRRSLHQTPLAGHCANRLRESSTLSGNVSQCKYGGAWLKRTSLKYMYMRGQIPAGA